MVGGKLDVTQIQENLHPVFTEYKNKSNSEAFNLKSCTKIYA